MADFANLMGLIFGDKEIEKNKKEMLDRQVMEDEKAKLAADQAYKSEVLRRAHPTLPEEAQQLQDVGGMGGSTLENLLRLRGRDTDAEMQANIAAKYANINNQADDNELRRQEIGLRNDMLSQSLQDKAEKRAKAALGERLPASEARVLGDGKTIPELFDTTDAYLDKTRNMGGPIKGRLQTLNPYDTEAQTFNAHLKNLNQLAGKFQEGGVLRAEDTEKYKQMLPQLTDTADLRKAKLREARNFLELKYNNYLDSYQKAGYDVSKYEKLGQRAKQDRPTTGGNQGNTSSAFPPRPGSRGSNPITDQLAQAKQFLATNPNHPQAEAIKTKIMKLEQASGQ